MSTVIGVVAVLVVAFVVSSFFALGSVWNVGLAVVLWALTGALAGRIIRGTGYGFAGNIVLGLLGALVGNIVIIRILGLGLGDVPFIGPVIVGCIGALILVMGVRLFHNADFGR